jgi:hypothetical protein
MSKLINIVNADSQPIDVIVDVFEKPVPYAWERDGVGLITNDTKNELKAISNGSWELYNIPLYKEATPIFTRTLKEFNDTFTECLYLDRHFKVTAPH